MYTFEEWKKNLIIVRGGGDIATGTIYKLYQSRFPVLVLEIANPSCIRRTISFCEAFFDKKVEFWLSLLYNINGVFSNFKL